MINSENKELAIAHTNELSSILNNFNPSFILDTVKESIGLKLNSYNVLVRPNIVRSYEDIFKQNLIDYPFGKEEIIATREEVYSDIIKILCDEYQLAYEDNEQYDLYTTASYMYDLLVSSFHNLFINFLYTFIYNEKEALYTNLNLEEKKKIRDLSTIYAKRLYIDDKIGIICANLPLVLETILAMDISFNQYIDMAFFGMEVVKGEAEVLKAILHPINDFYRVYISSIIDSPFWPNIITDLKIMIQSKNHNKIDMDDINNKEE